MYSDFNIKKDKFLVFFFIFLGALLTFLVVSLFLLKHFSYLEMKGAHEKYTSYLLADQLRQSSDDLTKMVRLYVITGDVKYKKYFYEILSIRQGKTPRPQNYHQIYWDLVTEKSRPRPYGKQVSLQQLMLEHGFTMHEFALLENAKNESNDLADMEEEAMKAAEESFRKGEESSGGALARNLVFGPEYMKQKAKIMMPIQKFLENVEVRTLKHQKKLERAVITILSIAISLSAISLIVMLICIFKTLRSLSGAIRDNERLLLNILPSAIASRLKEGEEPIVDEFDQVSVLFADISGFIKMTERIGGAKMVALLNELFGEFDKLTEKYQVEKIKTMGDSYMAVLGIPNPTSSHGIDLANFALDLRIKTAEFAKKHGIEIEARIGMSHGHVIAGIIGQKKFIYDLWGDTVNIASRMESAGVVGEIQITEQMALLLGDQFIIEPREEIEIKGKGKMKTFFLKGRKDSK